MTKRSALIIVFTLSWIFSFGNGGTINSSLFRRTGNIAIVNSKSISLDKENLIINLAEEDKAHIEVTYTLTNTRETSDVLYGFPVDFYLKMENDNLEEENLSADELKNKIQYSFYMNGVSMPLHSITSETFQEISHGSKATMLRIWFISQISFPGKSTTTLTIKIDTPTEYTSSFYDDPDRYDYEIGGGNRFWFSYDLYPAKCWTNSTVDQLAVTIIKPQEIDYFTINGWPLKPQRETADSVVYVTTNYKFEETSKILIEYATHETSHVSTLLNSEAADAIKDIRTSSTLKGSYAKENLLDQNLKTAWCEGNTSQIPEWIEFELKDNFTLTGLAMVNGYTKSAQTYAQNSLVMSGKVLITGVCYDRDGKRKNCQEENSFTLNERTVFSDNTPISRDKIEFLPYSPKEGAEMVSFSDSAKIKDRIEFMKPQKIKISFDKVYPGAKYTDSCISELLVYGFFR